MCKNCYIIKTDTNPEQKNCAGVPSHVLETPWVCCLCEQIFCGKCVYHNMERVVVGKTTPRREVKHFCFLCMDKFYRSAKSKL